MLLSCPIRGSWLVLLATGALSGTACDIERLKSENLCHTKRGRMASPLCAVARGQLFCWGTNKKGEVGIDSSRSFVKYPTRVPGLKNVTSLAMGYEHVCVVASGKLHCWGSNADGRLGLEVKIGEAEPHRRVPRVVALPDPPVTVHAGSSHTCVVTRKRKLFCWGNNGAGQLGFSRATHDKRPGCHDPGSLLSYCHRPQEVDLGGPVVTAAVGSFFTCALTADGTVRCWGSNETGQLGRGLRPEFGNTDIEHPTPQKVDLPEVRAISARSGTACAVDVSGGLHCWGADEPGLVNDRRFHSRPRRLDHLKLKVVTAVGVGESHICAVTPKKELLCWGENDVGQLGLGPLWHKRSGCHWLHHSRCIGHDVSQCTTPQRVLSDVRRVTVANNATVAETGRGHYVWGHIVETTHHPLPAKLKLNTR